MEASRCIDLRFAFPGADRAVLSGVSLSFPAGTTTAVMGPSGAGKSTLLRLLAGLLKPDAGQVVVPEVSGHDQAVSVVFQDPRLLPWLTVRGNLDFALEAAGVPAVDRRARWRPLLEAVGLAESEALRPSELSGGMAQRVGVVRALALRPRLLLLDEPFAAVDPLLRDQLQSMLATLLRAGSTTAVLVTHDVREAVVLADRVVILEGAPSSVRQVLAVDVAHPRDGLSTEVTASARAVRAALSAAMAR